jgi:hypothetical protein
LLATKEGNADDEDFQRKLLYNCNRRREERDNNFTLTITKVLVLIVPVQAAA